MPKEQPDFVLRMEVEEGVHFQDVTRVPVIAFSVLRKFSGQFFPRRLPWIVLASCNMFFFRRHGGGKRCAEGGCNKSAVGGSNFCTSHGGGKRCQIEGCDKSAQSSTKFCVKHGGGKKCQYEGCEKVARGKTLFCAAVSNC